ncbi:putative pab1 binding protein [Diplodia seriata]|uniref:Putative pab1 binding protein n=1 Tax=Diplodia seriata TaxID=420778 RepID=A0A0G2FRJ7_9PEZI|nr:putative pab1 binding protein [Diplodia seriata]
MIFLISNFVGMPATVTLKSGERFSGIFSSSSLEQQEYRYTFKMVKRLQSLGGQVNGTSESQDDYCGVGQDHRMVFDVKDVVVLNVENVAMDKTKAKNGASIGFKTDSDISGHLQARERDLKRWVPAADTDVDLSLGDNSGAGWDQFETNERLFGATSNYDEDLYTTKIDRNDPRYRDRAAKAERLAREIESGSALNAHVLEERGQAAIDDSGLDEEEKYSGVKRDLPSLSSARKPGRTGPNTVEHDLLDSFKQFSANEKMKIQERQRHAARHDKNVKLNDLKKFAMNFNYSAPIPEDLIPILAKDPSKQQEIKQKSQKAAEDRKSSVVSATDVKAAANNADVKTQQRASGPAAPAPVNQRGARSNQGPYPQAPRGDRNAQNIPDLFNPVKRMKKDAQAENKSKDLRLQAKPILTSPA